MSLSRILLFGKFQIQHHGQTLLEIEPYKVQELFCYLLLHRNQPHPREMLATLLWADSSTAQSKKYLRQVLWQLQKCSKFQSELFSQVLLIESDWIQINPSLNNIWLDVAEFEQAFDLVKGIRGRDLSSQNMLVLQNAVDLYRGDLLEGYYQDWCLYERERLQNMYLAMLEKLMGYCEAHQEYEQGQLYGERILHYDRTRESIHQRLMRLHYLSGHRTVALRQYEHCVTVLEKELGVGPSELTVALYNQIRADRLADSSQILMKNGSKSTLPASLPEIQTHLKQLQGSLADIQHQVKQNIELIEQLLKEFK